MQRTEINEFYVHFHVTRDPPELRDLVQLADLFSLRRRSAAVGQTEVPPPTKRVSPLMNRNLGFRVLSTV